MLLQLSDVDLFHALQGCTEPEDNDGRAPPTNKSTHDANVPIARSLIARHTLVGAIRPTVSGRRAAVAKEEARPGEAATEADRQHERSGFKAALVVGLCKRQGNRTG